MPQLRFSTHPPKEYPDFRPNVTPREMFLAGVFGGTYWRPIYSSIVKKKLSNQFKEFKFLKNIPDKLLSSSEVDLTKNKYKVHSGTSLEYWEKHDWITAQDPYGWVQWYCRFYAGRRSPDDARQIKRWLAFAGPNGRFSTRLRNLIKKKKDSPVIRQGLLQWGLMI